MAYPTMRLACLLVCSYPFLFFYLVLFPISCVDLSLRELPQAQHPQTRQLLVRQQRERCLRAERCCRSKRQTRTLPVYLRKELSKWYLSPPLTSSCSPSPSPYLSSRFTLSPFFLFHSHPALQRDPRSWYSPTVGQRLLSLQFRMHSLPRQIWSQR